MAADLRKFDSKAITDLQAHVRGALVRSKLNEVQQQFEDIVHSLDGPDYRVLWDSKTLSFSLIANNIEDHEKRLSSQNVIKDKIKEGETTEDEEDTTITQENCDRQKDDLYVDQSVLLSIDFQKSVRENLEDKFDMALSKDAEQPDGIVCGSNENMNIDNGLQCSQSSNSSTSAKDAGSQGECKAAKISGIVNGHGVNNDSGIPRISKSAEDSGITNEYGNTKKDTGKEDYGIAEGFKNTRGSDIIKESRSTKESGSSHNSRIVKDSGSKNPLLSKDPAKVCGYKSHEQSSGSESDTSIKTIPLQSCDVHTNSHSGMTSPASTRSDVFIQHSTPMSSQGTCIAMNDDELRKHPLLTDSWMTEKSFDPVRSDDNSSISDLSVGDLQHRKEQISMELLWTQQAIESRKNYLRLKKTIAKNKNTDDS